MSQAMSIEGLDRDLENARVLLEEKPWCDSPEKYRKTAEGIILRFLAVDPENKAAKALLEKARAPMTEAASLLPLQPAAPQASPLPSPPVPSPAPAPVVKPARAARQDLAFVAQVPKRRPVPPPAPVRKNSVGGLAGITLIVAIAGVVGFLALSGRSKSGNVPQTAAAAVATEPVSFSPQPESQPPPPTAAAAVELPAPTDVSLATAAVPPPPQTIVRSASPVAVPIQTGTLAISSPTTVDIYLGDQLVGSAPTTLTLPAGNQSLEYRHQGLRKVVTHVIKPNETTTAMVTFDIPVQINAKPWAQVSIDGSQRQPLGQTPLGEVKVPIGSMLLFENPNYPSKTYRVTGRESEIRVSFP